MTLRALIAGYYGAGNAGDEVILEALVAGLRRIEPAAEDCVLSYDPEATRGTHNVKAIGWNDFEALQEAIRWSTLVIVGGGLWQDYWGFDPLGFLGGRPGGIAGYGTPILLAHLLGKPSVMLGAGVGPLNEAPSREAVRDLAQLAAFVSTRDAASRHVLIECGVPPDHVHLGADLAFLAGLLPSHSVSLGPRRNPLLGVSLRPWDLASTAWEGEVIQALEAWQAHTGGSVLLVPLQESSSPVEDDRSLAERVARALPGTCGARVAPAGLAPRERLGLLGSADVVLGMRYHAVVAALQAGVPCVGLAYDPKVRSLMDEASVGNLALSLKDLAASVVVERLLQATERPPADRTTIERLRARAEESLHAAVAHPGADSVAAPAALLRDLLLGQARSLTALERALQRRLAPHALSGRRAEGALQLVAAAEVAFLQQKERAEAAEGRLAALQAEIAELEDRQERQVSELQDVTRELAEVQGEATGLRAERGAMQRQLDVLRSTRGVRLLNAYWKIRSRLAPSLPRLMRPFGRMRSALRRLLGLPFRRVLFAVRHGVDLPENRPAVYLYTTRRDILPDYPLRRKLIPTEPRLHVSLGVTVRDEARSARAWFDAILSQSRLPDEIVIIDNGSSDSTPQLLRAFAQRSPVGVKILDGNGKSIAECRNICVAAAIHPVLAFTDFGCIPDVNWLRNLIVPLEQCPEISVSAGWYGLDTAGSSRSSLAVDLVPSLSAVDPGVFIPATRSLAVRREALEAINGFPGWLSFAGEDTYVGLRLKHHLEPWAFVPEAVVRWTPPSTLTECARKLVLWARGDGESGAFAQQYWRRSARLIWLAILALGGLTVFALGASMTWMPALLIGGGSALAAVLASIALAYQEGSRAVPLSLRFIGQSARVVGFLQGVKKRPEVNRRRYANVKKVVLILAATPWDDTGGGSRGAQLASEFLSRGDLVVYLYRFPRQESAELHLSMPEGSFLHMPLAEFDWRAFSWEFQYAIAGRECLAVVEIPDRGFLPLLRRWRKEGGKIAYDLIDNWSSSLGGSWYSEDVEAVIVSQADLLIASAPSLADHLVQRYGREPVLLPNAANLRLFDPTKPYPRPQDLPTGRFIATYVGALWGEWFDWELLALCARTYPDAAFVLIGDYRGQCPSFESNLYFLGLKSQNDLPAYLSHTDVGFIPWKVSPVTRSTSPLKVYEYLAMGVPVVAPALEHLERFPLVYCSATESGFIERLGTVSRQEVELEGLHAFLEENSWTARVNHLEGLVRARPGPAPVIELRSLTPSPSLSQGLEPADPGRAPPNPSLRVVTERKALFSSFYANGLWPGPGSSVEYTENIRGDISRLLPRLGIRTLLDAPCGDYAWFRLVAREPNVAYIGGDIVDELVAANQRNFGDELTRFEVMDITSDELPLADLWLCRDCLFHFSNADIFSTLENFLRSKIRYLLTTTHPKCAENADIPTGSFRLLNLEIRPFNFEEPIERMDDWIEGQPVRQLALWERVSIERMLRFGSAKV